MVRLYPLIEPRDVFESRSAVGDLLKSGIRFLQLRGGSADEALVAARSLVLDASAVGVTLIVNNRAEVAARAGVGLHVGQDDMPVAEARRLIGPAAVIGYSTHAVEEVAGGAGANYIAIGPIFPTRTKSDARPVVGVGIIPAVRAAMADDRPLVAIGGITFENWRACIEAGADYVAAISLLRDGQGKLRADAGTVAGEMRKD